MSELKEHLRTKFNEYEITMIEVVFDLLKRKGIKESEIEDLYADHCKVPDEPTRHYTLDGDDFPF